MSDFMIKIAIVAGLLGATGIAKYVLRIPNDNPIEQSAEAAIKDAVGLDIDLTPETAGS